MTQQMKWQPIEDGNISSFMYVDNGGKLVGIYGGDDTNDWYATEDLPDGIRVCALTPVDEASVPSLSASAIEEARLALEYRRSDILLYLPGDNQRLAPILAALKEFDELFPEQGAQ